MTDRRTLCDRSAEELETLLLRYARSDGPSASVRRQAMARAAAAATASAGAGAAAAIAGPKVLSGIVAKAAGTGASAVTGKLLVISLVSGALAVGAVVGVERLLSPPEMPGAVADLGRVASTPHAQTAGDFVPRDTLPGPFARPATDEQGAQPTGSAHQLQVVNPIASTQQLSKASGNESTSAGRLDISRSPSTSAGRLDISRSPSSALGNASTTAQAGHSVASRPTVPQRMTGSAAPKPIGNPHGSRSAIPNHRDPAAAEPEASPSTGPDTGSGEVGLGVKPSLARELGLLEQARTAIERGAAREALSGLDQHRREFPAGRLVMESAALRIEALAAVHRNDEAASSAKVFLNTYPDSPLADRVRTIIQRLAARHRD